MTSDGNGTASCVAVFDERRLLDDVVASFVDDGDWQHLLSYGPEEWERYRGSIRDRLGVDLGPCPDASGWMKAVAKGTVLLDAWLTLLRGASDAIVGDAPMPLDGALVPIGVDAPLRAAWDDTLARLGFTEREGRAFMAGLADRLDATARELGDGIRLPRDVRLLRLGAFHLVRS